MPSAWSSRTSASSANRAAATRRASSTVGDTAGVARHDDQTMPSIPQEVKQKSARSVLQHANRWRDVTGRCGQAVTTGVVTTSHNAQDLAGDGAPGRIRTCDPRLRRPFVGSVILSGYIYRVIPRPLPPKTGASSTTFATPSPRDDNRWGRGVAYGPQRRQPSTRVPWDPCRGRPRGGILPDQLIHAIRAALLSTDPG